MFFQTLKYYKNAYYIFFTPSTRKKLVKKR